MTVKVSFVTHLCDVEFSDEAWAEIEAAARANNQTPEEWIVSAINAYIGRQQVDYGRPGG